MNNKILVVWDTERNLSYLDVDFMSTDVVFINSRIQFEELKRDASQPKFDSVCILAEANWQDYSPSNRLIGYEVLEFLLINFQSFLNFEYSISISVFSIFEREVVYDISRNANSKDYRGLVMAFPPKLLAKGLKNKLDRKISLSTFDFKRNSIHNIDTILNNLEHKISLCFSQIHDPNGLRFESFKKEFSAMEIVLEGASLKYFKDIASLTNMIDFNKTDIEKARIECEQLEVLLKRQKNLVNNVESKPTNLLRGFNILVVEDDQIMQNIVCDWLRKHGAEVKAIRLGSEAIGIFEEAQKEGNKRPFDCVFTDLELKEDIFLEDIQGMDIIQYCQDHFKTTSLCVLTGMPKKTVSKLISDKSIKLLFKKEDDIISVQVESNQFITKLARDIKTRRALNGPKRGPRVVSKYTDLYYSLAPVSKKQLWSDVITSIKTIEANEMIESFNPTSSGDFIEITHEQMVSMLANRIIILMCCLSNTRSISRQEFDWSDLNGYLEKKKGKLTLPTPQNLLNNYLGFHYKSLPAEFKAGKPKDSDIIKIECITIENHLFDEEWRLIQKYRNSNSFYDSGAFLDFMLQEYGL